MSPRFRTTSWSLVRQAAHKSTPEGRQALAELCEAYWYPLYAFVRRQGHDVEEAADLTQAYFLRLLEKDYLSQVKPEVGRFRSFLLASLKHFLSHELERAKALKRGGGLAIVSLDTEEAERRYQPQADHKLTPERLFEKQWAMTILERVIDQLREEFSKAGKSQQFEQFTPYLSGEEPKIPYKLAAEKLDMSEGAVKVGVHRLRGRFRRMLQDEVAVTVSTQDQVESEIRHLLSSVS